MRYLFQVNIGPIQAFIASARRTRDLKFGSWLLSELAKAAAKEIVNKYGLHSLIFPAPNSNERLDADSNMNVANKIVALIDSEQNGLQALGDSIRQAVLKRLHTIKEQAYKKVTGKFDEAAAEKQVNALIEFFWVAVPYEDERYNYNRQELEAVMAARKNTRDFDPVSWGDPQYKSSIDGQFEGVIPDNKYAQHKDTSNKKREKAEELYKLYGAGLTERLSGIDLLKRHGVTDTTSSFPSTSHMASLPFLVRLEALKGRELQEAKNLWNKYTAALKEVAIDENLETVLPQYTIRTFLGNLEGSMLFEERFVDVVDMTDADKAVKEQIQVARRALRSFYTYVDSQLGNARPYPYYAILSADGDRMGKTIDHLAKHSHGKDQHRELSQALDGFAESVNTIVKEHQGALVYAGGDDVLALVPLHTVVECASILAKSFKKALRVFNEGEDSLTLSVGIAIVHHLDSLQESLSLARATENKAKSVKDKNALAITIRKRSGGETSIAGKWDDLDKHLERLISYYSVDAIPDGTAYELQDLSLRLSPQGNDTLQKIVRQEAKRILHRKLHGPQDTLTSDRAKEIEAFLLARLEKLTNDASNENTSASVSIENFVNELLVAQTLADVRKIANYKEK